MIEEPRQKRVWLMTGILVAILGTAILLGVILKTP
jgi:hypothetical protein